MKGITSILLLFLFNSVLFGNSGHSVTEDPGHKARLMKSATLNGVFFEDYSSGTIFIDFDGMTAQLASISILRNEQALFTDPVDDLPLNTIYELNTELMRPGNYTIELVTVAGTAFRRDIWVE